MSIACIIRSSNNLSHLVYDNIIYIYVSSMVISDYKLHACEPSTVNARKFFQVTKCVVVSVSSAVFLQRFLQSIFSNQRLPPQVGSPCSMTDVAI